MSTSAKYLFLIALTLSLLPAHAELELRKVASNKIYFLPGEEARFEVTVANPDAAPASAVLRVELISDLDTHTVLAETPVKLEAGKDYTWAGAAKMAPMLGMELRAMLLRDGKTVTGKSDYFSCARSVHHVLLFGSGNHGGWQFSGMIDKTLKTYPDEFAGQLRATYGNCVEKFAWGPSDFDDLTPTADRWWAGQTGYNECKTNMVAMIDAFHRQGIRAVTYGKAAAGGIAGYEKLRRNPDLAGYTNGRFWGSYNAADLDYLAALGAPKPNTNLMVPAAPDEMEKIGYAGAGAFKDYTRGYNWCDVWYSCTDPRVADAGINELIGSAKMFGFDGVRFDGEFFAGRNQVLDGSWNAPENLDTEAANLALTKRMKEKCWAACPGYLFGYNAGTDITWSIGRNNVPPTFREKCKDDGLIGNESYAFPGDVPWPEYCLRVRREAEIVRYYGGHYATYAFNRGANNLYNAILQFGLRAHLMNAYVGPGKEWVNRSATRFSKILWDDSLSTWHTAPQVLTVTGSREILWKETVAIGEAPGGGTRYVIHLYNTPESKTTAGDKQLPAGPAANVSVSWKGLAGVQRAFLVDMQNTTCTPITPQGETFQIGEVPYWTILVVDIAGKRPAPTFDEPPADAKATGPSAEDLQLVPSQPKKETSWRVVLEPEAASVYAVTDPDALNGSAVRSRHIGLPVILSYLYCYPRIPGKYRATFRLKVADNTQDWVAAELTVSEWNNNPLRGVPQLPGDTARIRLNEFKKANTYQDFTVDFEQSDVGFREPRVIFHGASELTWDRVTVELVEPWTDQQLAEHYRTFKRPTGIARANDGTTDLLVVRGLYNRLYQVDKVADTLHARISTAYTAYHPQYGTTFSGIKWDWEPLWAQDVIVLANVETRGMSYGQVLMLAEWVKDGGGLVILGGNVTLGQDDNMARGWPLFLPVALNGPWEIRKCDPPVKLAGSDPKNPAAVLYRHLVTPKKGATVLLKGTKGEPLLVGAPYGKGRVAVFTGTVLGEAPAGMRNFWETSEWVDGLSGAIRWVANLKR